MLPDRCVQVHEIDWNSPKPLHESYLTGFHILERDWILANGWKIWLDTQGSDCLCKFYLLILSTKNGKKKRKNIARINLLLVLHLSLRRLVLINARVVKTENPKLSFWLVYSFWFVLFGQCCSHWSCSDSTPPPPSPPPKFVKRTPLPLSFDSTGLK